MSQLQHTRLTPPASEKVESYSELRVPKPEEGRVQEKRGEASTTEKIVSRIAEETGISNIVEVLSKLGPRDLSSLLLAVFNQKAVTRTPLQILTQYTDNVLTNPAEADPLHVLELEKRFYEILPSDFKRVDLSILNPIGTNSALATVSQKTVLSSVRDMEVLADISVALSLEAAKQRKELKKDNRRLNETVMLAACQRVARLRQRPTEAGYNAHWKMLGLATAGREPKPDEWRAEMNALLVHTRVYAQLFAEAERAEWVRIQLADVSLMENLLKRAGLDRAQTLHRINTGEPVGFKELQVPLPPQLSALDDSTIKQLRSLSLESHIPRLASLDAVREALQKEFPQFTVELNLERTAGMGYYQNSAMHFLSKNKQGEVITMVDGGTPDWTQKMLCDRKESIFVSGMGSELFIRKFGLRGAR